jgi:hypothetical protein
MTFSIIAILVYRKVYSVKLDGYARDVAVEHNYSLSAETPTTSDLVS